MQSKGKVRITVVDRLGKCGWESERGKMCPMASHIAFPYVDILRYGGNFGGDNPYETTFWCSDPKTIIVYKIELVKEENN